MDDTKSSKPVLKLEDHLGTRTVKKIWNMAETPRVLWGTPAADRIQFIFYLTLVITRPGAYTKSIAWWGLCTLTNSHNVGIAQTNFEKLHSLAIHTIKTNWDAIFLPLFVIFTRSSIVLILILRTYFEKQRHPLLVFDELGFFVHSTFSIFVSFYFIRIKPSRSLSLLQTWKSCQFSPLPNGENSEGV